MSRMTVEEYLAFERPREDRHEYVDGQIRQMISNVKHSQITGATLASIYGQLRTKDYVVMGVAMRVKAPPAAYYYPDVVVAPMQTELEDEFQDTLLNPVVIAEVLAEWTEDQDRGEKFHRYLSMPTVKEYLLVDQDKPRIEHFVRREDGRWLYEAMAGLAAVLELPSIGCTLALADVYENVTFEDESTE